jgi:hypothetical protein
MFSWASPWTVMLCMYSQQAEVLGLLTNLNSRHILIDFREDGVTPYATLWKHGLEEMKV